MHSASQCSYCILKQVTGGIYNTHCTVNGRTLVTDCVVDLIDLNASLEPDSSVSIVSGYGVTTGRSKFDTRQRQRIFLLTCVSRQARGSTQPPVQWVLGVLSPGVKRGLGVTLTIPLHLVLSL
jgi:hypothetical protein